MSKFKMINSKWLDWLFPEWNWEELSDETYKNIFQSLNEFEDIQGEVVEYLKDHKVKIGFHTQYKSGGGWTLMRNITLRPGDDPLSPHVLSLIVHETLHLKQSIWMRLSVQGELRAWQYQKKAYRQFAKKDIGDIGEAYSEKKLYWDEIATLDSNSRGDLLRAQGFMRKVSPDYRSPCLPLFPLPQEVGFYWKQGKLKEAFQALWNLVTCR